MKQTLIILVIFTACGISAYCLVRPLLHSPDNRIKIAMTGRSTMGLWFKHWNWPYPLRIKTTYRNWPIAYNKYTYKNIYFEYLPVSAPWNKDPETTFGEKMLQSFKEILEKDTYDAAFFKYCFVDFPVKDDQWQTKLHDLKKTVIQAHEITSKKKMKLIVGNALPLLTPSDATIRIQKEFNSWLLQFATSCDDVLVFDFFGILTDERGIIKNEFARGKDDPHPNDRAYSFLDNMFFEEVSDWLR